MAVTIAHVITDAPCPGCGLPVEVHMTAVGDDEGLGEAHQQRDDDGSLVLELRARCGYCIRCGVVDI